MSASLAIETIEALKKFAAFCEAHDPAAVALAFPEPWGFDAERFLGQVATAAAWLHQLERALWIDALLAEEGTSLSDTVRFRT